MLASIFMLHCTRHGHPGFQGFATVALASLPLERQCGDNEPMQTLRNAHLLARFVLVWFVLSMGVAIASPLVQPKGMQLICSAAGAITVQFDQGGGGASGSQANTLDCPLCAAAGAPPPQVALQVLPPMGLAYALQMPADPQGAYRSAAPFPPRGPPVSV